MRESVEDLFPAYSRVAYRAVKLTLGGLMKGLYRGKTGVGGMAAHAKCPVVPVGLIGTREIMSKDAKLPKATGSVAVRFGKPIDIDADEAAHDPLACRSFVDALMFEIRLLSGQ